MAKKSINEKGMEFLHTRASSGRLMVVDKNCPRCYGKKAFDTPTKLKCTRCRYVHDMTGV